MPRNDLRQFICMECGKEETYKDTEADLSKRYWARLNVTFNDEFLDEVLCKGCWTTFLYRCKERKR